MTHELTTTPDIQDAGECPVLSLVIDAPQGVCEEMGTGTSLRPPSNGETTHRSEPVPISSQSPDHAIESVPVISVQPTAAPAGLIPPVIAVEGAKSKVPGWLHSRAIVVVILLICGPLGLPALWLCPRFSRTTKIVSSVLFLTASIVVPIALSWYWLDVALRPLVDAMKSATP